MLKSGFITSLVLAVSLVTCSDSYGTENHEVSFKFGGWSYHQDTISPYLISKSDNTDWQFNESHDGVGVEYSYLLTGQWRFVAGAFSMKDSYRYQSMVLGAGIKYRWLTPWKNLSAIDFNLALTHMNRGQLIDRSVYNVYQGGFELARHDYEIVGTTFTQLMPYLTVHVMDTINLDIMLLPMEKTLMTWTEANLPNERNETPITYFIRMGITF